MTDPQVVIIGTGFAGLGAAIALRRAGVRDLVILERATDVGGTWRDNIYPGCRCDVQSALYSFSFAPKPDWSETYPSQPELREYLRQVARDHGLLPLIRFGHEVTAARWRAREGRWQVVTSQGEISARYLIAGTGALAEPGLPELPGLETFTGPVMHSARWDPAWSAAGQRVAIIGTGASAVQILPVIQPLAAAVTLFQRTPPYVLPHDNRPVTAREKARYRRLPVTQRASRIATYWRRELLAIGFLTAPRLLRQAEDIWRRHLEAAITDPRMREQLTPAYRMGCKRILLSNDFYPALAADNVSLVSEPVTAIEPGGVITSSGARFPADTIVAATGFRVTDNPMHARITGRGGQTLASAFDQTYLGTVLPGFPNFFHLTGANTGLGHTSMVHVIESQLSYIVDAIRVTEAAGGAPVEVRPGIAAAWNERLQRKLPGTIWGSGCSSWYLDSAGRNLTLWPGFTFTYRARTRRFRTRDFVISPPG